jgi:hypothetical protein
MALLQMVTVARGLSLEIRTGGRMRLTAKAPKCSTLARRFYGLSGNREKLYAGLLELIAEKRQALGVTGEEVQALARL